MPPILEITDLAKHFPIKRGILGRTAGAVRAVVGDSVGPGLAGWLLDGAERVLEVEGAVTSDVAVHPASRATTPAAIPQQLLMSRRYLG